MYIDNVTILKERFPTNKYYPFNIKLFSNTKNIDFKTPITFFIGENGTGKSTLIKAMAKKCGIHLWEGVDRSKYQYNKYEDLLYKCIDISWIGKTVPGSFFSAEFFRNFAEILDEWAISDQEMLKYFGGESLLKKSHGQCNMAYFESRYKINGIYFLDEPESALSPKKLLEFAAILMKMSIDGHAQFFIATHSPFLLAIPGTTIYSFNASPIKEVNYEDTDYYKIYKEFMDNPHNFFSESK
jgi:predicted ATPase